jgi:hypothetical protein
MRKRPKGDFRMSARDRSRMAGTRVGPVHESPARRDGERRPATFPNRAGVWISKSIERRLTL